MAVKDLGVEEMRHVPSSSWIFHCGHSFTLSGFFKPWKHAYKINAKLNVMNSNVRESINAVTESSLDEDTALLDKNTLHDCSACFACGDGCLMTESH